MARLGFIGTGHMAGAMVRHLAPRGHEITVTHRGAEVAQALVTEFPSITKTSAAEVVAGSDIVFLCLRPEVAAEALQDLPFREDQRIISVMAGISRQSLAEWCAPAAQVTLMLPMELIQRGGCPIVVWPEAEPVRSLFEPENGVIAVENEADLSACFAATTLVSAVAEVLDVGSGWLGERIGPDAAQEFVGRLVTGMLDIHADRSSRFALLRDSLATPGTLNISMVQRLRGIGLADHLRTELDELER
ncbi:NAD(P)-binding domain-containing protein [Lutimaribacter marinistellae]|uniref:NAD(P)-binding domain-containing protein n=1 Tax=Lutimaribacter marinistellae TaxID=1820329 RepID=A0ABV7TNK5_9RHOB